MSVLSLSLICILCLCMYVYVDVSVYVVDCVTKQPIICSNNNFAHTYIYTQLNV